jgi:hypothetical protein
MAPRDPLDDAEARRVAQDTADHVATALEDVGFDVGREFPMLRSGMNIHGSPTVDLGRVSITVADRIITVLKGAAERGVTL